MTLEEESKKVLGDTESPKKTSKNYIALFEGLVDIALKDEQPHFLVKEDGELKILKTKTINGKEYSPPPPNQMEWLLPRYEKVIEEYSRYKTADTEQADENSSVTRKLFDDLVQYHKSISDLPKGLYSLIAAWDFHTYLQEKIEYSPEMVFYAVPERGKSRTGKGMLSVAYRGVHIVSIRESFIFRMAELCGATLFFDIRKLWETVEKNGCDDLFLHRFEKGGKVPRVLNPERGAFKDTRYYSVFGPTILASNAELDEILGTRCVTTIMQDSSREFEADVKPIDGLSLKEKLTAFRAWMIDKNLPSVRKPAKRRLGDILRPLLQIVRLVKPEAEKELLRYINDIEKDTILRRSETLAGKLVAVMLMLRGKVDDGAISLKHIVDTINEGTPERYHLSPKRVGSMLTSLGLRESSTKGWKTAVGSVAIPWNENKLTKLAIEYGVNENNDEELAHPSETSPVSSDSSDYPQLNNEQTAMSTTETDKTGQTDEKTTTPRNTLADNPQMIEDVFGNDILSDPVR